MDEIRMPNVLDPDRMVSNSRDDMSVHDKAGLSEDLEEALHQSCQYGQQLWRDLDAVRGYLLDSLPPVPGEISGTGRLDATSAAPTGPEDEDGWQNWIAAYAAVTSALAGPRGDSGYGMSEARREAQQRRATPTVTGSGGRFTAHEYDGRQAAEDDHRAAVQRASADNDAPTGGPTDQGLPPGADDNGSGGGGTRSAADSGRGGSASGSSGRHGGGQSRGTGGNESASLLKTAGMTGLVVLAFRGLTGLRRHPAGASVERSKPNGGRRVAVSRRAAKRDTLSAKASKGKATAKQTSTKMAGAAAALAAKEGLTN
ncbi:hypothetical protein [Jatrophihabitans lederbergiae]|uniref:Uncharacterized protein n=1 Tax=Jatrophihabitans lederbergiae TaxID=3075547 RepID=A0ABU2J8B9_9ACTN|nr:hypothetical protein [Jatrophihabitans sp. DSM 44399]MDT0261221.1 hypothetical protein [Jatrophihabitans sp. DSM 44399]